MTLLAHFLAWTCMLYWLHRFCHWSPWSWYLHGGHHDIDYEQEEKWSWWHLLAIYPNRRATADQWVHEIVPSLIYVAFFPAAWPLLVFYYLDGVIFSEGLIDHNPHISIPGLAHGRFHLKHHEDPRVNFGEYIRLWDYLFRTGVKNGA